MEAIGGKWKISILCSLSTDGATRYNDLKRKMNGISNTMLAKSLKELEDNGLVKRTEYMEVPIRVEYEATQAVKELIPIMLALAKWGSSIK
jgi:DNA-binding HxlR family transcriptional regulator